MKVAFCVTAVFTPVLAEHSKSFSLIDCISVGVDRMQRSFEPMRKQVEVWQKSELTDVTTKVVNYEAFVEGKLEAPKHLARTVHDLYFEPSTRNSVRERSGVCRMRLCLPSKNLTRFRNSGRRRTWVSSWRLGSRKCFNDAWRCLPDRRAFITLFCRQALRGGRCCPYPTEFPLSVCGESPDGRPSAQSLPGSSRRLRPAQLFWPRDHVPQFTDRWLTKLLYVP